MMRSASRGATRASLASPHRVDMSKARATDVPLGIATDMEQAEQDLLAISRDPARPAGMHEGLPVRPGRGGAPGRAHVVLARFSRPRLPLGRDPWHIEVVLLPGSNADDARPAPVSVERDRSFHPPGDRLPRGGRRRAAVRRALPAAVQGARYRRPGDAPARRLLAPLPGAPARGGGLRVPG